MSGALLLDTCSALWIMSGEVSAKLAGALARAHANGVTSYVSPITAWEIGVQARKGQFRSRYTPQRWFSLLIGAPGMGLADLTPTILLESQLLPGPIHGDPADRILAATAREFGYTVVTRDRALLAYAAQGYLSAVEC